MTVYELLDILERHADAGHGNLPIIGLDTRSGEYLNVDISNFVDDEIAGDNESGAIYLWVD